MTQELLDCLQGEGEEASAAAAEENTVMALPVSADAAREEKGQAGPAPADAGERPDPQRLREHLAGLVEQAAAIPGFDLERAMRDAAFVRLTAPGVGVSVRDAWYALHREESERLSAEESRALLARAAAASARRPREGGGSGGAALIASDYRRLSREEQLRVKKRIFEAGARGEKLYP